MKQFHTDAEIIERIDKNEDGEPTFTVSGELARLSVALLKSRAAEAAVDRAVHAAREAGYSWQEIGNVLGMTRQGALKKFRAA